MLWSKIAGLPLVVEACEFERLHAVLVMREDGNSLHEARPALPLAGEWTLAGFCDHVATLELWPQPPEWDGLPCCRFWAFESAALDLALRQAGRSLHGVLGLAPQPVRFVNSLGLGKEPSIAPLRRRLARCATTYWTRSRTPTAEAAARGLQRRVRACHGRLVSPSVPAAAGAARSSSCGACPRSMITEPSSAPR